MSDDEDNLCPLCVEEMDLSDKFFKPCPCEYQICRFCWHHIKENLNQRCPACRRIYTDEAVQFRPVTAEEMSKLKADKKAKQRQKKEREAVDRKHLSNVRVVQKNLVYVVGLNPKVAVEEILRSQEYFGQYGKIIKLVINRKQQPGQVQGPISQTAGNHLGVYVTYATKPEAAKAIAGIDSNLLDGRLLRATYGTTKYCQAYLRHQSCMNSGCMYLHEPGEEADSFSKEELAAGKHHQKEVNGYTSDSHRIQIVPKIVTKGKPNAAPVKGAFGKEATWETYEAADDTDEGSALPATASWANKSSTSLSESVKIQQTGTAPTSEAGDANSEIGDRGNEEEGTTADRQEQVSESRTSLPKQDEQETSKEITESVAVNEPEQPANIEKSNDARPRHASASGLEITLPFAYATGATDPFAFSFNSPISVPDVTSPAHLRTRNDFGSTGVMGFPPGHEEHAQQVQYNGSFDPFSEVRVESPVLKNAPGLLPPRMDVGPRYGLGLINPPGVVLPGMHPHGEYRSSFDPFQEDVPPVPVLPPPGISSPSASSARLSRPPGLYDPPPPQSPVLVNPMYHSHQSQPGPTQNSQTPRKSSRFGFAQDRQNNVPTPSPPVLMTTATMSPRPSGGTFRPELSSAPEPMDSLHEGFRALFPTANVSFGGEAANRAVVDSNALWNTSPKSPLPNPPFANLQNSENASASWSVPFGTPNRMQAAFAARSESWNEGDVRKDPLSVRPVTSNNIPPSISSAQDFLGAFLKAAQKSSPTEEVATRVEKGARFQGALTEHEAIAAQRPAEEVDTRRRKAPFQDPAIMLIGTKSVAPSVSGTIPPNGRHRLPIFEHVAQGEHGRTNQGNIINNNNNGRFRPGNNSETASGVTTSSREVKKNEDGKQNNRDGTESVITEAKVEVVSKKGETEVVKGRIIGEGGGSTAVESRKQQTQQRKTKRGNEKAVVVQVPPPSSTLTNGDRESKTVKESQAVTTTTTAAMTSSQKGNGRKTNHGHNNNQRDTKKGISTAVEESVVLETGKKNGSQNQTTISNNINTATTTATAANTNSTGQGNLQRSGGGGGKKNRRGNNNNNNNKKEETKNGSSLSSSSSVSSSSHAESVPNSRPTPTTIQSRRRGVPKKSEAPQHDETLKGSKTTEKEEVLEVEEEVDERDEEVEEEEEEEKEERRRRKMKKYERERSGKGQGRKTRGGEMDDVATLEREVLEARREAAMVEDRLNELIKKNRTYQM